MKNYRRLVYILFALLMLLVSAIGIVFLLRSWIAEPRVEILRSDVNFDIALSALKLTTIDGVPDWMLEALEISLTGSSNLCDV